MTSRGQDKNEAVKISIKYRVLRMVLLILVVILLGIVTVIPGVLRILYRADAQVALGHAKSVRLALRMTATESCGGNRTFCDASHEGGVAESIWREVIQLSKAPGDFQVLQVEEDGYTVKRFYYQEGDFMVWYNAAPGYYTVYRNDTIVSSKILQDR